MKSAYYFGPFGIWRMADAIKIWIGHWSFTIPCWYNRMVLESWNRDYGKRTRREWRRYWREIRKATAATRGKGEA